MIGRIMEDPRAVRAVEAALDEDLCAHPGEAWLDATSEALVPDDVEATGQIYSREPCVVAGTQVARFVFSRLDPKMRTRICARDGKAVKPGEVIMTFTGKARSILKAERTCLNFMQRLSATATLAAKFVKAVKPYGTMILDTRKTTPGLRVLEKYAVRCGGGANHRMGLYDRILMKDNHRALWRGGNPDKLDAAVVAARKAFPSLAVEIEVESLRECRSALKAKPEWIMLDNMSLPDMAACARMCKGISLTEASGGITLDRAREVAATGVDAISLGCLTHSAGSVDLTLEWRPR